MTDICEVLRRAEERGSIFWTTDGDLAVSPALFGEAADEIERLRADLATARLALLRRGIDAFLTEQENDR